MVSPYSLFLLKPREGIVDFGPVRMLYQIDGKTPLKLHNVSIAYFVVVYDVDDV
jgi:hypothetical protein